MNALSKKVSFVCFEFTDLEKNATNFGPILNGPYFIK